MAKWVGQHLGNYRLVRLIGEGSFAEVYLGEHVYLGTPAALKVLASSLTSDDVKRFRREAQTIAQLKHPHIVPVLEFGVEEQVPFLVMEYAPHGTLRTRHPGGTQLAPLVILPYVQQIAAALQYAHEQQVIHRDLKPENILLGEQDQLLVSDFGMALSLQSTHSQDSVEMMGTVTYMAPEQIQAHSLPASDQYALGIMIYEWLVGKPPFQGSLSEVVVRHLSLAPPSLHTWVPTVFPAVETVVMTALDKDPQRRFASMQAFATAFDQACQEAAHAEETQPALHPLAAARPTLAPETRPGVMPVVPDMREAVPAETRPTPGGALPHLDTVPVAPQGDMRARGNLSRRRALIGLAGVILVGGGLTWFSLAPQTPAVSTTGPSPMPTPSPMPATPTPTPAQGAVLLTYHAQKSVSSLAWSPDGRRIVSGSAFSDQGNVDHTVRVWDATTGQTLVTYQGHTDGISGVAWSPDGTRIASASQDQTVQIWEAGTGKTILTHRSPWPVASMAWSPDGARIVSGASRITAEVWEASTGNTLVTYQGPVASGNALSWSPDSQHIASASQGTAVQVWSAATGSVLFTYSGHMAPVFAVAWSPDGTRIASGGDDENVKVWNATTRQTLVTYEGQSGRVDALAWSPDSQYLVSGASDVTAQLWVAASGQQLFVSTGYANWVSAVAWSPDGSRIASGSLDGTVQVWTAH